MGDDGGGVKVAAASDGAKNSTPYGVSRPHSSYIDPPLAAETTATGIKQIMWLRELLHKWQAMALGAKGGAGEEEEEEVDAPAAIPPYVMRRLQRTVTVDSDDENCQSPEPPPDVPRGYCPVYVGPEQRRFVIPTGYLGHPVFRLLLEKAEEEFGFRHEGALAIPCETETFKYILQCVERHDKGLAPAPAAGDGDDAGVAVDEVEQSMETEASESSMMHRNS